MLFGIGTKGVLKKFLLKRNIQSLTVYGFVNRELQELEVFHRAYG